MAITKVGAMTNPPAEGDFTILQAKLEAYAKQIGNQGMILTQWTNTTTAPKIAMGSYITHGGTLFIVDTEDYVIPAPAGAGTYYLKVAASGATLAVSWGASLSGYTWNAIYNGLYHADESQILPYQLVMAGGTLTKRKITNLMQGSGFVTVDWTGATNYVNQGVKTTDSPTFATINTGGLGAFLIGQNLRTTDNVSFGNINPPVDNSDISPPSIGKGGFTYAVGRADSGLTLPSGGTYVVIALPTSGSGIGSIARLSGGTHKVFNTTDSNFGYLIVRIE